MPLPPLIEKLLLNAIHVQDGDTELVVFKCSLHGPSENAMRAKVADCEECWAIAFLLQNILCGEGGEGNTHRLGKAMADACQAERGGSFDFIPSTNPDYIFDDAVDERIDKSIVLTDS